MDRQWPRIFIVLFVSSMANALPFFRRHDEYDNNVDNSEDTLFHLSHLKPTFFGVPSNVSGERAAQWHRGSGVNPEELGEYAEGDILFPPRVGRNGLTAVSSRWPRGVVPYTISSHFNPSQRKLILDAMNHYRAYTCIRFKPHQGESDFISITGGKTGCWSSVGRIGGAQEVNLQVPVCVTDLGTSVHELMHALGVEHEQSRYDRDDYVSILWQNILPGKEYNFNKISRQTTNTYGVAYDYGSVMHYSGDAFSVNGQPTIVARGQKRIQLGQRIGLSRGDIQKIRRMYRCGYRKRSVDQLTSITRKINDGNNM